MTLVMELHYIVWDDEHVVYDSWIYKLVSTYEKVLMYSVVN